MILFWFGAPNLVLKQGWGRRGWWEDRGQHKARISVGNSKPYQMVTSNLGIHFFIWQMSKESGLIPNLIDHDHGVYCFYLESSPCPQCSSSLQRLLFVCVLPGLDPLPSIMEGGVFEFLGVRNPDELFMCCYNNNKNNLANITPSKNHVAFYLLRQKQI